MTQTQETKRLRLIAYGRVSTSGQVDGYGPEVQTKAMRRWARLNKCTLVDVLFDGAVSGTVDGDERPSLAEAMERVSAGEADGILSPNLDRLARELTVQEGALTVIWAHGGRFFTVDQGEVLPDDESDPMRTFVRQVMGAAAQLERGRRGDPPGLRHRRQPRVQPAHHLGLDEHVLAQLGDAEPAPDQ